MTIERGQKKLRETEFFYRALRAERERTWRPEPEAMDFYLSAFLSSARSVTLALQKDQKVQYDAWFPDWFVNTLTDEERTRMDFLRDQRNSNLKEGETASSSGTEQVPISELQRELALGGGSYRVWGSSIPGTALQPTTVSRRVLSFDEPFGQNVVVVCEEHLAVLRRLVTEFQQYLAA